MSCGPARPTNPKAHARNAVFYGDKAIDRSPLRHRHLGPHGPARRPGELAVGDDFVHESIIGTLFDGRVEARREGRQSRRHRARDRRLGPHHGYNTIFVDDRDPFAHGFQLV